MEGKKVSIFVIIVVVSLVMGVSVLNYNINIRAELEESTGWQYYKSISISNSLECHQMKVNLYKGNGIDDAENGTFYLNDYSEDFPNDIRFCSSNNATEGEQLPQWLQENSTTLATYWINTTTNNYSTIYLFTGNENASLNSSAEAVFPFSDTYGYYFVNSTATFYDIQISNNSAGRPYAAGTASTTLQNGTAIIMYNSGVAPRNNGNYRAYHTYSFDNGTTWTDPVQTHPIGVQGTWSILSSSLCVSDNGTLLSGCLNWHSRDNSPCYVYASYDNGTTWDGGEDLNIPHAYSGAVFPFIKLSNGTMLIGATADIGDDPGEWGTYLCYSDDNGTNWNTISLIPQIEGVDSDETTMVELLNGSIYQSSRTEILDIYHSFSPDGGWEWGTSTSSGRYNGKAPQFLQRISENPNRIIFLLHNNTYDNQAVRIPLNVTYSVDDCTSFKSLERNLIYKSSRTSYPTTVLTQDDCVLVTYANQTDVASSVRMMKVPIDWFFAPYWQGDVESVSSTSNYSDGEFTISGSNKYINSEEQFSIPCVLNMKVKVSDDSVNDAILGFGDASGTPSYYPENGCAYIMNSTNVQLKTRVSDSWCGTNDSVNATLDEYELRTFVINSTSIKVYYNGTLDREITTNIPSGNMSFWFTSTTGSDCNVTIDSLFVTTYSETMPSFSGSGGWVPTGETIQFISIQGNGNQTTIYTSTPTFNWTNIDAGRYNLQIATDAEFTSLVVDLDDINVYNYPSYYTSDSSNVSFTLPTGYGLTNYGSYYCRVRGYT